MGISVVGPGAANGSHNPWRNAELHSGEAPFEGVIAASWEGHSAAEVSPRDHEGKGKQ